MKAHVEWQAIGSGWLQMHVSRGMKGEVELVSDSRFSDAMRGVVLVWVWEGFGFWELKVKAGGDLMD